MSVTVKDFGGAIENDGEDSVELMMAIMALADNGFTIERDVPDNPFRPMDQPWYSVEAEQ